MTPSSDFSVVKTVQAIMQKNSTVQAKAIKRQPQHTEAMTISLGIGQL